MKSFTARCAIIWLDWATYDKVSFSARNVSIRSEIMSSKKKKKAITPFLKKMRRCCGANSKLFNIIINHQYAKINTAADP